MGDSYLRSCVFPDHWQKESPSQFFLLEVDRDRRCAYIAHWALLLVLILSTCQWFQFCHWLAYALHSSVSPRYDPTKRKTCFSVVLRMLLFASNKSADRDQRFLAQLGRPQLYPCLLSRSGNEVIWESLATLNSSWASSPFWFIYK